MEVGNKLKHTGGVKVQGQRTYTLRFAEDGAENYDQLKLMPKEMKATVTMKLLSKSKHETKANSKSLVPGEC